MVVTISNQGYVKRIPLDTYRQQGRGGKGITAMGTKDEDFVDNLFVASTHQYLLVLTEKGQLYWLKVHRIPKAGRTAKGQPIVNLIQIQPGDKIHAVVPMREFSEDHYLAFATNLGVVKRTPLADFSAAAPGRHPRHQPARGRAPGRRARDRRRPATSSWPAAAAWPSASTRPTPAPWAAPPAACAASALGARQEVVGMVVIGERGRGCTLLAITQNGYGKRTPAGRVPHPEARRQGPDHHQVQRPQRAAGGHPRRARRARS